MEITRKGVMLSAATVAAMGKNALSKLRARCTATAIDDGYSQVPTSVCCLVQHADGSVSFPLHVPRVGLQLPEEVTDTRRRPVELKDFPTFHGTLDAGRNQVEAQAAILGSLRQKGAAILSIPCGMGKTCVAINVACTLRVRTLIVVHKAVLMSQWEERLGHFAPGARIGKLQGATMDTDDKHFVIAMLQSLCLRDYDLDSFDLVIADECIHIAAKVFSTAFSNLCASYSLGLSAFVERRDGLTDVTKWFLGEVCYAFERKGATTVQVEKTMYKQPAYEDAAPTFRNGQLALCRMLDIICGDNKRNELVLAKAESLARREGRSVLILSDRRAHCEHLCNALVGRGIDAGLFLGGTKQHLLDAIAERCRVIVGTYAIASEGLDIPRLNALVMATPKSDIRQTVGRIMRGASAIAPVVIDIVDYWGPLIAQGRKRDIFYNSSGFTVVNAGPRAV